MSGISQDVRLAQLQADADRCGPEARALFDRLIADGKTPEAAAMYACQQAPGTRFSDRAFCAKQRAEMENMAPVTRRLLLDEAKKGGINVSGKFYVGGPFGPKDARSWASTADDVLTVCKANNLNCDGPLKYKAARNEPKPAREGGGVAPDIANLLADQAIAKDPALQARVRNNKRARRELQEQIIDRHSRKKHVKRSNRLLKLSQQ